MKICLAQTRPIIGNIAENIVQHKKIIAAATQYKANWIIFPELSITGYEPDLADELATNIEDARFDDFQILSDRYQITIALGVPIRQKAGVTISMLIFQPHMLKSIYSKQYLHADEEPFFTHGVNNIGLLGLKKDIAPAICYEVFMPQHAEDAYKNGAKIYLSSVAKSANGMEKANILMPEKARKYNMTILMANAIGPSDNFISAGQSGVWNTEGVLLGQLESDKEGILIFDTQAQSVIVEQFTI